MPKNPIKAPDDITGALWDRIWDLVNEEKNGLHYIREFGLFIDTHRDQPHVGCFEDDIHRGMCKPTNVDYILDSDEYYEPVSGKVLQRHAKHQFVDPQWLADYEVTAMMSGKDVRDQQGFMPTSHLRDARAKKYHLWSFRQVVMSHYNKRP
jgi:hypothetical protein